MHRISKCVERIQVHSPSTSTWLLQNRIYRIYRSDTSASSRFEPSTFSKLKQCSIGTLPGGGPGQQSQPPAPTVVTYYYVAPPRYHTGVVPHNNTVAWKCLCAASIKIKYHENCWLTGWPCSIVEPCGTSCSIGSATRNMKCIACLFQS